MITSTNDGSGPRVWQSRSSDSPEHVARLYRKAAGLITAQGYSRGPEGLRWETDGAHSVSSALEAALVLLHPEYQIADLNDASEDAHARLAGYLHFTGLRTRRTSIADMCDEVTTWERDSGVRLSAYEAALVLRSAAAVLSPEQPAATAQPPAGSANLCTVCGRERSACTSVESCARAAGELDA